MSSDDVEEAADTEGASAEAEAPKRRKPRRTAKKKRKPASLREPPPRAPTRASERSVRAIVLAGAASALVGIALVGTRESRIGAGLVIVGLLTLIASIHKLGRLGPEDAR